MHRGHNQQLTKLIVKIADTQPPHTQHQNKTPAKTNTIKHQNRAVGGRWVLEFCFSSVFYLLCVWVVISLQGLLFIGLSW
jgi:hypothetical protein